MHAVIGLLTAAISVLSILIVIRILISYFPVSPYNPLVNALRTVVDPVLAPFRRVLPTFAGIDFSPMLALLVLWLISNLLGQIEYGAFSPSGAVAFLIVRLVLGVIVVFCVLLLIRVVLSLLHADPWHPLVMAVRAITNPLVRPFAGLVPRSAGTDLAAVVALAAFVAFYFIARALLGQLLSAA